jgi:hypothetical protein
MNRFMIFSYYQVLFCDQMIANEVDVACDMWGRSMYMVLGRHVKERNHLEDDSRLKDNSKVDLK